MDLARATRGHAVRVRAVAIRVTIGLIAGAVLVAAFLRLVSVRTITHRLVHLNLGIALLCAAAFLAAYVVRAMRWRCLLTPDRVSIRRAVAIYQIAIFLNWLLPIRGGEVAMSLLLRHTDGIPVNKSLAAVSMDKAMDLMPAACLLALAPFAGLHLSRTLWLVLAGAMGALGVSAGVLAARSLAAGPGGRAGRPAAASGPAGRPAGPHRAVHHRVHRHPAGTDQTAAGSAGRGRLHRSRPDARRAVLPAGVLGRRGECPPARGALRVHAVQLVVHPAFAAWAGRQQRTHRAADLLRHLPGRPRWGRRDVPVLAPVDGTPDDVQRHGLPERDEPDPARHIPPGQRSPRLEPR